MFAVRPTLQHSTVRGGLLQLWGSSPQQRAREWQQPLSSSIASTHGGAGGSTGAVQAKAPGRCAWRGTGQGPPALSPALGLHHRPYERCVGVSPRPCRTPPLPPPSPPLSLLLLLWDPWGTRGEAEGSGCGRLSALLSWPIGSCGVLGGADVSGCSTAVFTTGAGSTCVGPGRGVRLSMAVTLPCTPAPGAVVPGAVVLLLKRSPACPPNSLPALRCASATCGTAGRQLCPPSLA
jgi:hypothetical protein